MKRSIPALFFLVLLIGFLSCSGDKKEQKEAENTSGDELSTVEVHEGFESLDDLTKSVIKSIKEKDYESYIIHVMTREEELAQSRRIENDTVREAFVKEFSFSLHEEEEYFNNMIKYLHDSELNLDRSMISESIVIDYEDNKYAPVELKEVIIPIEHDEMENDLVYVAIKIDGKWFLTAELGI
jgi:ribosomal protein L20